MNEGEACTRSWVFLNIGWRTEDRNFSERGNSMQHILNPHSILPYWVIHTGQTETEMPVWCALLYNYLDEGSGILSMCKEKEAKVKVPFARQQIRWNGNLIPNVKGVIPTFQDRIALTSKAAKALLKLLLWQSVTLRLRNMLSKAVQGPKSHFLGSLLFRKLKTRRYIT